MCGIAVTDSGTSTHEVWEMLARLEHRGPDDRAVEESGQSVFGHSRLAIVDPEGGHQPLRDEAGSLAVCNGEIYNHQKLRRRVGGFRSGSDAAVLLPLFGQEGAGMPGYLDGMFAFVLSDESGRLVAARDPIGIKPLYRAERGRETAFASELKALIGTSWERIEAIPPGHIWEEGNLRPYYRLPDPTLGGATDGAAIGVWSTRLGDALRRAVGKRLMSDVPLGAFLSGGIDSSIVTALAAREMPGLNTFSLGFEGSEDLEAARLVARHLGTNHHEILVPEDEPLKVLPEVLYHLESWDRDLVRSALPNYLVARFAARRVKVVLTGEGADELFGGYGYHAGYAHQPSLLQRELRRSVATMHDSNLQRVDRMTMAHSLEARVPFLDPEVVDVAMKIPAELKIRPDGSGRLVEKWILRAAFADLLPPEIVWRTKSQFDEGSGTTDRLPRMAAKAMSSIPDEPDARLRDTEEAWYFTQVRDSFGDWATIRANTSVWSEGRT